MQGEIKLVLNDDLVWERFYILLPHEKIIKKIRIIGSVIFVPVILGLAYMTVRVYGDPGEKWRIFALCLMTCGILYWYCLWGFTVSLKAYVQKRLDKMTEDVDLFISFDEEEIKISSETLMQKETWEGMKDVYENENYWIFGGLGIPVDKRMLTEEEFAFLKDKNERIKAICGGKDGRKNKNHNG